MSLLRLLVDARHVTPSDMMGELTRLGCEVKVPERLGAPTEELTGPGFTVRLFERNGGYIYKVAFWAGVEGAGENRGIAIDRALALTRSELDRMVQWAEAMVQRGASGVTP